MKENVSLSIFSAGLSLRETVMRHLFMTEREREREREREKEIRAESGCCFGLTFLQFGREAKCHAEKSK